MYFGSQMKDFKKKLGQKVEASKPSIARSRPRGCCGRESLKEAIAESDSLRNVEWRWHIPMNPGPEGPNGLREQHFRPTRKPIGLAICIKDIEKKMK